jgi:hypothetical protein
MTSRDPEPGAAPDGGPVEGRSPAPASFEHSADHVARFSGRLAGDDREPPATAPADPRPAADGAPDAYRTGQPSAEDPAHVAASGAEPAAAPGAAPKGWRAWTGRRPFVGGVLMTLGGVEILVTEKASLGVVIHVGMQGLAGYLVPAVLVLCGLLTIFNPAQRLFYSVLGVLLALGSWLTSNLGGFFIGLLLGLIGSCLAFGWLPEQEPRRGLLRRARGGNAPQGAARS